jgi:hypothetical protein
LDNTVGLKDGKVKDDFFGATFTIDSSNDIFTDQFLKKNDKIRIQKFSEEGSVLIDINLQVYSNAYLLVDSPITILKIGSILFLTLLFIFLCIWRTSSNRFSVPIFSLPLACSFHFFIGNTLYRIYSADMNDADLEMENYLIRTLAPTLMAVPFLLLCLKQKQVISKNLSEKKLAKFKKKFMKKKQKG